MAVLRPDEKGGVGWRGLLGALWFSAAPENNRERERKEKKTHKKKEWGGLALIAAELRRDALIAPSGCGQYRGRRGGGGVQCKTSSSLPDVVIGPYVGIFDIHQETDVLERKHSWEFTWWNPAAASRWPSETAAGRPLCVHVWGQACRTERTIKRYRTFNRNK